MRLLRHSLSFSALVALCLSFSFSGNEPRGQLQVSFRHVVGSEALRLDSSYYKNELGQTFTVSKFKYYISNVSLKTRSGESFFLERSFLLDEEDQHRKQIILSEIPFAEYDSIGFIIGVDSLHNCSGAQSGDLDPMNAMFWAWNTGYIFMKLEGVSPQAKSPGHFFEYHIGGYRAPDNCIRHISLPLLQPIVLSKEKRQAHIILQVDILELLKNPSTVDFEKLPAVTDHHHAAGLADNYRDMFSVVKP